MPRAAPLTPGPLSSPPDCTALRPEQSLTVYLLQVNVGGAGPRAAGPGDGMPCIARGPAGGWRGSSPVFITPLLLQMRGPGRPSASRGQQRKPGACVVTDGPLSVHPGGTAGCHAALPCTCNVPGPGGTGPGPVCVKPSPCAVESGRRAQRDRAAHACGAPTAPALRTVPGGAGPAGPGPGLRGPLVCRAPVSLRPAPPLPWDSCAAHAARRESREEGAEEGNPR